MVIETLADTQSLFDKDDFGIEVHIGSGRYVVGVFDQNFDASLEVNGRRTGLRLESSAALEVAINSTITLVESDAAYYVRAKEPGARTTLLILEAG